jgi:hypothetical protein
MKYSEILTLDINYLGRWTMKHRRPFLDGFFKKLLFKDIDKKNALMDEGELDILNTYFRANSTPTGFYFGLGNNGGTPGIPAETVGLAGITEVSGTGYARIAVARDTTDFGAPALDAGDYMTTTVVKTFTGGAGGWTAADYLFLTDQASGTAGPLIATVALSASRVLLENDTLDVSLKVKLQ